MTHSHARIMLLTALAFGLAAAAPEQGGRKLSATLSGASEVPSGTGDPDGSGTASVTVNPGQKQICYSYTVENIGAPAAAHIHTGAAGAEGPPAVVLAPGAKACVTTSQEIALAILKNPADYYVNVHTAEFPDGAVRGQLAK